MNVQNKEQSSMSTTIKISVDVSSSLPAMDKFLTRKGWLQVYACDVSPLYRPWSKDGVVCPRVAALATEAKKILEDAIRG